MIILGISGKKQSGKNTVGNFILSLFLAKLNFSEKIYMDEDGSLIVSDILGDTRFEGVFDIEKIKREYNDERFKQAMDYLATKVKIYSFADILKKDICMNILGLSYEQCYGTDEEKNTLTSIRWENMPGYDSNSVANTDAREYMTAREIMQALGTDIFRKIKSDVWVTATINKIIREKPTLAVVTDCRFPNEVEMIKQIGGKVIRLTRNPFPSSHVSENILDKENYDWSNFDYVIDNQNFTIIEQFEEIKKLLGEILPL